jgi:radical SAM superfamily enzyme YgiQ (UPF0313 family)
MAKILFIQNSNEELYGIMSIASYVKKRHDIKVITGNQKEIVENYNSFKPDIVGMYVLTQEHTWALKTAETIKSINPNAFVLLGGPHPTFYTEILNNKSVDAICIGEGEKPVLNLLDNFNNAHNVLSLWVKKGNKIYKNKIDSILKTEEIPIPDRTIYKDFPAISQSDVMQVICSRGCPFNCFFCINYSFKKMYGHTFFRVRKIEDIINEIIMAKNIRNIKRVLFQDDIFGVNKIWLKNFLEQYKKKINLPFYCLLRCDSVTEDLIDMLLEARCYEVGVGIESGDKIIREKILNKHLPDETITKAVKILHQKKIGFHTFNMFSLPEEDLKSAWKTLKLNIKIKPDVGWSAIFQPYPGTKFCSDEIMDEITKPDFDRFKINYKYSSDFKYIQRLQKFFMITVKFPVIQYVLPILIRLPLDNLYDKISKLTWHHLYAKKLKK